MAARIQTREVGNAGGVWNGNGSKIAAANAAVPGSEGFAANKRDKNGNTIRPPPPPATRVPSEDRPKGGGRGRGSDLPSSSTKGGEKGRKKVGFAKDGRPHHAAEADKGIASFQNQPSDPEDKFRFNVFGGGKQEPDSEPGDQEPAKEVSEAEVEAERLRDLEIEKQAGWQLYLRRKLETDAHRDLGGASHGYNGASSSSSNAAGGASCPAATEAELRAEAEAAEKEAEVAKVSSGGGAAHAVTKTKETLQQELQQEQEQELKFQTDFDRRAAESKADDEARAKITAESKRDREAKEAKLRSAEKLAEDREETKKIHEEKRRLHAKTVAETPSPFDGMSQQDKSQTGGQGAGTSGGAALTRVPGSAEAIAEAVREAVLASNTAVQNELRDLKLQIETLKSLKETGGGGQPEMSKQERAQRETYEDATRRVIVAENMARTERAKSNAVLQFMQYAGGVVDRRSRGDADPGLFLDEDEDPVLGELNESNLEALGTRKVALWTEESWT
ncbi:unnamed protein product [Polarella glacialis]|uniref:Uncharacterized protein n=1 Tax=Polarella glacialis TaxID=89957 RepID=A0A813L2Y3_POLGL|nr:unnamed protein product [Polarella glacialis]